MPKGGDFGAGRLARFALPVLLFSMGLAALMHIDILFAKAIIPLDDAIGHYTAAQAVSRLLYFFFSSFGILLLLPSPTGSPGETRGRQELYQGRSAVHPDLAGPCRGLDQRDVRRTHDLAVRADLHRRGPAPCHSRPGIACLSVTLVLSTLLQAADSPRLPSLILTGLVVLDVALLLILIPRYGLSGAAAATAIAGMVGLGISGFAVYKVFRVLMAPMSVLRIALASAGSLSFPPRFM